MGMAEKFIVVVGLAAIAPGASAASARVSALVQTATGSPRDYTRDERADAVRALGGLATDGDGDAVSALVDLLGGDLHGAALQALADVRGDAAGRVFTDVLGRVDVGDARNASRVDELCGLAARTRSALVVPALVRVANDGATKEVRVAALRSLGGLGAPLFAKEADAATDAATVALVGFVDHRVLGAAARDVLSRMRASTAALRPLLTHSDPELRALAVRMLGGSGDDDIKAGVQRALIDQLKNARSDDERARALRALGRELCGDAPYGKPDEPCDADAGRAPAALVIPHVMNEHIGAAAVDAVARVRDPSLVLPLVQALDHPSSTVRERSAELLGKIGDARAKKALLRKLDTTRLAGNWSELDAYLHGVVGCGIDVDDAAFFAAFLGREDIANTSFASNHPKMWQSLGRLPPSSSKAFTPLLRSRSREVKRDIARLLGQLGDPAAAVALLDVVEENGDAKDEAAQALSACADERALPRMQKLLDERLARESWNGGGELARAYVRIDRASGLERTLSLIHKRGLLGIELLRAMLDEPHPSDAKAFALAFQQKDADASTTYTYHYLAIAGFGALDTPQALDTLVGWATTHKDPTVRTQAAIALKSFPEPKAVRAMVTAVAKVVAERSGDADDIVRALQDATGEPLRTLAEWQVYVDGNFRIGGGEAALTQALSSTNAQARALAATQLGAQKKALSALQQALPSESSAETRLAILQALMAHDDKRNLPVLLTELEKKRATWPERVVLARALDRLGDGRGTLALVRLVDSRDGDDAQRAMVALSAATGEPPTSSPPFWRAWWKEQAERYRLPDR